MQCLPSSLGAPAEMACVFPGGTWGLHSGVTQGPVSKAQTTPAACGIEGGCDQLLGCGGTLGVSLMGRQVWEPLT